MYLSIYLSISISISIYLSIYIERAVERDLDLDLSIYKYIYIHTVSKPFAIAAPQSAAALNPHSSFSSIPRISPQPRTCLKRVAEKMSEAGAV